MKIKNIILTCIVLTLALLMFSTNSLATENITFTDSVFKEQVLYHGMTADFSVADQNSDGEISVEEAEQTTILSIYNDCSLEDLKKFPNLTRLSLNGYDLENLSELDDVKLDKLEQFWVSYMPKLKDISSLSNFTTIKDISISSAPIENLSSISYLTNLETIYFSDMTVSNVNSLNGLSNLKRLVFTYLPNLTDVSGLNNLPNLEEVRIYSTEVGDISGFANSPKLKTVAVQYHNTKNLDFLKNNTNLTYLDMSYGTLEDISGLENCTNLQVAILNKNNISSIDGLGNCVLLETLNISTNPISNIEVLAQLNTKYNTFIDTDVNPYDEATFHVICTIKEKGGNFLLGDCSRFEPKEDENGLTYILNKEKTGYILTGTNVEDLTEIIIPSKINGLPVIEIADNAFQTYLPEEELTLTKIVLNEGLEIIGDNAFDGQNNISGEIIFPTTLKKIGNSVFEFSKISKISLNEGLEYIGDSCFASCNGINGELYLPDTLTYIGSYAFEYCVNIDGTIKIPKKIYEIKNGTFSNCKKIDRIDFGENLEVIEDSAFGNCIQLKGELILPPKLKKLGENAFSYCRSLKGKVVIPEGVETMTSAFSYCDNIEEIVLHNNIKEIACYAFRGLKLKKKIVLPDSVEKISWVVFEAFEGVNDDLIIPNNVKTFEPYAMFADSNIKNVVLPAKLDTIPFRTFYLSNVESIVFPREVETVTIEDEVFDGCLTIEKIIIYDNVKEIKFANEEVIFSPENGFSEDFAIYGYTGTYAEEYAKEKGYKFVAMNGNTLKETDDVEVNGETISVMPIDNLTKIEEVLNVENFPTIGDYEIVVVDKDGNEKDSTQKLGSRDVIQIKDDEGNVIEEHVVIVNGDVNGDGELKMYDSFQILKGSIMNSNNDAIETLIRDKNGDGKVMMYDAFQFLKQAILG